MKPQGWSYQIVTQVKILSPEIICCAGAKCFHLHEGNKLDLNMVSDLISSRGLSPRYGCERISMELGRFKYFSYKGIGANNPKRKEGVEEYLEVGLSHNKGVAGVTTCAAKKSHLKVTTLFCRGRGKHIPYEEMV